MTTTNSELCFDVPTYYGDNSEHDEFDTPNVPVLIREAAGVRVLLGTHDENNRDVPDVQLERRAHGWAVFLNGNAGDTLGVFYFHDDGRSWFDKEWLSETEIHDGVDSAGKFVD